MNLSAVNPTAEYPDEHWMGLALDQARAAEQQGEVPVGAVLVYQNQVLATGHNLRESTQDPTTHAEIIAIRQAAQALGSWRLIDVTCYVTLEPCPMCAGALVNSRISRVVYGCPDPKAGATDTLYNIGTDPRLNHQFQLTSGVRAEECAHQLTSFFANLRNRPT